MSAGMWHVTCQHMYFVSTGLLLMSAVQLVMPNKVFVDVIVPPSTVSHMIYLCFDKQNEMSENRFSKFSVSINMCTQAHT